MIKEYRQFTTSVKEFKAMCPAYAELYCRNMVPGIQFRFATFEKNDYRRNNTTCLLYNYVPDSVFFQVESPLEIEPALDELIVLNPGVEWYWVSLKYFDQQENGHASIVVELRISEVPMRISANGILVCK